MTLSMKNESVDNLVIGAGLAGLAAGYQLVAAGKSVLVLEATGVPGGRASTLIQGENILDRGAQFVFSSYNNTKHLGANLGLQQRRISATQLAIRREGRLNTFRPYFPISLLQFSGLSLSSRLRLVPFALDLVRFRDLNLYDLKSLYAVDDLDLATYFQRVCGAEFVDWFAAPAIGAVWFHSIDQMSRALVLGLIPSLLGARLATFRGGIGELGATLASKLPVRFYTKVELVRRAHDRVLVRAHDLRNDTVTVLNAQNVILAIPGDMVRDILEDPTAAEAIFFSEIEYASTIVIHCRARTDLFRNKYGVWFCPKEEPQFAAMAINPYAPRSGLASFVITLRTSFAQRLLASSSIDIELLKKAIQQRIGPLSELEILNTSPWKSAVPIFRPGYIRNLYNFKRSTKGQGPLYYCGDYLEAPLIEGAVTSGLRAAFDVLQGGLSSANYR